MKKKNNVRKQKLWIFTIGILVLYFILSVAFYYMAGEQLRIRDSRGNLKMPLDKVGSVEIIVGNSVEQTFTSFIQVFEGVNIQFSTYYRQDKGTIRVSITDTTNQTELLNRVLDASKIQEREIIPFLLDKPLENTYGHTLLIKIVSEDGVPNQAVTPLIDDTAFLKGGNLVLNGEPASGVLCFSTVGYDYIWTGLHYKEIVFFGAVILTLCLAVIWWKYHKGKKSLILYAGYALSKYHFLIQQLVSRDFKTKYKRSVLGVLWSFLNPLLLMAVQYFMFSNIFKTDIENYHIYLLAGIVLFNYFSEACALTLMSILGNSGLITKVYIPKYIYPLSRILSSAINLLISMIPLIGAVIITGLPITKAFPLLIFPILCLMVFCLGLGLLLSASMVFFRDTQFIWNVVSMIWMYATPIFYSRDILPEKYQIVLDCNPVYYFITFFRTVLLEGISPEPVFYVKCFAFAFGSLAIGAFVFKKTQDKFILSL